MTGQKFKSSEQSISNLIDQIESGDLGLPDLQRPFVWDRAQVRDLFDSLYKGYPAGYFLLWESTREVDSHAIGTGKDHLQKAMIVDGQQRLTSLYAVIKDKEIINEDNEVQKIKIAFNPLTEEFRVANAASDRNPEFLKSIAKVWANQNVYGFINDFIAKLKNERDLTTDEESRIGNNLGNLHNLVSSYKFTSIELSAELDINVVAHIFQRINSQGSPLNSADFILTLMSVYRPKLRHQLEDFARASKKPSVNQSSPYNHFHSPSPDELLRVVIGLGLKRGVLQQSYQVLSGRNPETRKIEERYREQRFNDLEFAQEKVLNLTSWHEYGLAVKKAGFLGKSMLTSANNFVYTYLIFLIGKHEYQVDRKSLRIIISRWFYMSSITGRYTGSPESMLESDLRRIEPATDADAFMRILNSTINTQLTDDFWDITFPYNLESSAAWSPYLFGYYASLNLLDAKALFSTMRINQLLSPDLKQPKSPIERHHLFPKAYLASLGITGPVRVNQIANYAFIEWADNIDISDSSPKDYFQPMYLELGDEEKANLEFWHALPRGWYDMEYNEFLEQRRKLIGEVTKAGYEKLVYDEDSRSEIYPSIDSLLRLMETLHVEFKASARISLERVDVPEKVINDGVIKTVTAFLNTEGGTLGIGITDDGEVIGLQPDLDYKNQDIDSYENWLSTMLINALGISIIAHHIKTRFETKGDKVVCLVDVVKSDKPIYAKTSKGEKCFYIRVGNTTRILEGPDLVEYVKNRF